MFVPKQLIKTQHRNKFSNYLVFMFSCSVNANSICSHFTMECVTKKGFSLFLFFSFMILLRYSAEIVVLLTNVTKHNKPTQLTANGHKYEESKYFLFLLTKYMCCIFKSIFVFASLGSELSVSFFSLFFNIISNQTKGVFGPLFFILNVLLCMSNNAHKNLL